MIEKKIVGDFNVLIRERNDLLFHYQDEHIDIYKFINHFTIYKNAPIYIKDHDGLSTVN